MSEQSGLFASGLLAISPTVRERQKVFLSYGFAISTVSPMLTAWQLCKVYGMVPPLRTLAVQGLMILPHQTLLKTAQMNVATPVKEHISPWLAFGAVGVLQGGVYGQCTIHFSRVLQLGKAVSLAGMFRGSLFAGARDTISQGVPFMCSGAVQASVIDPLLARSDAAGAEADAGMATARKVLAVGSTSIFATFASQVFHNAQIKMQADHALSYTQAARALWREHGVRVLYMGGSARVALLLLVNGLNEALLKRAWAPDKS
jgi:hypothetical protein